GCHQRLPRPRRQPPLGAPLLVQLHLAVHPVHPLVVPRLAHLAQPIEALPEPPAQLLRDDLVQRFDHLAVARSSICFRSVVRRPREPGCLASALHRDPVLLGHDPDRFALGGRRQSFRPRTSLIAAFSRARSAYMRLSLAFSTSSSFSRLSSATDAPPYFDFQL